MSERVLSDGAARLQAEAATLDHVVIISDDLDVAIRNARSVGFTVVPGGTHGNGYTHNALIGFADGAYLELIAPTERGRTGTHRWFPRLRNGGGLADFCVIVPDLARHAARLRDHGLTYSEPVAMTRTTPAGDVVAWSLLIAPDAADKGWPFFIQDTTPRALRVPHSPGEIQHGNGAIGVADIKVLVRDIDRSITEFETLLSSRATAVAGDRSSCARLAMGNTSITLAQPADRAEVEHLDRFGPGPYALTLDRRDRAHGGADSLLDSTLFSGAKIILT